MSYGVSLTATKQEATTDKQPAERNCQCQECKKRSSDMGYSVTSLYDSKNIHAFPFPRKLQKGEKDTTPRFFDRFQQHHPYAKN